MAELRYIVNDFPIRSIANCRQEVELSLSRLLDEVPPHPKASHKYKAFEGIYEGPTSVAYLFLSLSRIYPEMSLGEASLKEWCLRYLKVADGQSTDPDGNCVGVLNEKLSYLAVSAASTQNPSFAVELCDWKELVIKEAKYNEWAFGQSGYLYLLRLAKSWLRLPSHEKVRESINAVAQEVIDAIMLSQPWTYKGQNTLGPPPRTMLGAGHGTICLITQVILTDPSYASQLEPALLTILEAQLPSGNWPACMENPEHDCFVQFCHGAPGIIISLNSLRPFFPSLHASIDKSLLKARECTWTRGLLKKDPNLCHGIAGNALAFDDDERFNHFLSFITRENVEKGFASGLFKESELPFSLLAGEAGRAWVWAVADMGLSRRCIGYNDV